MESKYQGKMESRSSYKMMSKTENKVVSKTALCVDSDMDAATERAAFLMTAKHNAAKMFAKYL